MAEPRICPQCSSPVPADAPQALCPKCLLGRGFAAEEEDSQFAATRAPSYAGRGFTPPKPHELEASFPELEILELIGHGGMGAVYKARQRQLDRIVALKILPPAFAGDEDSAHRFAREAKALARLSHPNIVMVHEVGERAGLCYFVMEYVDGLNLRQLILSGELKSDQALAIVPQICDALQYAHDQGIVHRDIKPENVLVDRAGRVKIADFGLAKLLDRATPEISLTRAEQVMGTPHYMAPEQFERPREVDHRADIYSLGVVLYELLTGELPVGRFAPPSHKAAIDTRLDDVVHHALEKEPGRRYQRVTEVKTDVERIRTSPMQSSRYSRNRRDYEYRSPTTVWGLPLIHIAHGIDPVTGRKRVAVGVIAIGDIAFGLLAFGGVAGGGMTFGGVSFGLVSIGGLAIGLLAALGGLGIGGLALGGCAVGGLAVGGCAVGYAAVGGAAFGVEAVGANYQTAGAREWFYEWAMHRLGWIIAWLLLAPLAILTGCGVARATDENREAPEPWLAPLLKTLMVFGLLGGGLVFINFNRTESASGPPDAMVDSLVYEIGAFDPWFTITRETSRNGFSWRQNVNFFSGSVGAGLLAWFSLQGLWKLYRHERRRRREEEELAWKEAGKPKSLEKPLPESQSTGRLLGMILGTLALVVYVLGLLIPPAVMLLVGSFVFGMTAFLILMLLAMFLGLIGLRHPLGWGTALAALLTLVFVIGTLAAVATLFAGRTSEPAMMEEHRPWDARSDRENAAPPPPRLEENSPAPVLVE